MRKYLCYMSHRMSHISYIMSRHMPWVPVLYEIRYNYQVLLLEAITLCFMIARCFVMHLEGAQTLTCVFWWQITALRRAPSGSDDLMTGSHCNSLNSRASGKISYTVIYTFTWSPYFCLYNYLYLRKGPQNKNLIRSQGKGFHRHRYLYQWCSWYI